MAEKQVFIQGERVSTVKSPAPLLSGDTLLLPRTTRVEGDLILPDTSGSGVKLGDKDSSSFGWKDITSSIEVRGVAATDPSWSQVDSTGFYAYKFSVADKIWMTYHVPHDIVPNTDVYFHVHWFPNGTDTNTVKWQFDTAYATGFNQAAFGFASPTTKTIEQAGPGTQYQHMVAETTATDFSIVEPDGLIHCIISRVTNAGTDNTDDIFVLTADVHYQSTDGAGSTVNKAPSFYG